MFAVGKFNGGRRKTIAAAVIATFLCVSTSAQTPPVSKKVFTLAEAVDYALAHYPAVRAALSQVTAAHANVGASRTIYLPQANALWQTNRGTRNNIFGQVLPQSIIPALTGPVLPTADNGNVWGSAAGVLIAWEPFDFGYRNATVNVARAGENAASAEAKITRLDVAIAVTEAYFSLLAAEQVTIAAQANVRRREEFAKSVDVLAQNQLRPGADASRAKADLAQARVRLIQAETSRNATRAQFAALLGIAPDELEIAPGPLLGTAFPSNLTDLTMSANPLLIAEKARIAQVQAREIALSKSYFPKFSLQATVSGRGTGAEANGLIDSGATGLWLQRMNWAAGVQVTFPIMQIFSLREQKRVEAANEETERARFDQTTQDISAQVGRARAELDGAHQVAANTPIELTAARDTEQQVHARYQAGLATLVEVSDAQSLLVQAEIDDAIARLTVWRSLAGLAAAQGDLQPFLQLLRGESH
jgi:outer membrane protein